MSESVGEIVGALTAYCVDPPSPGFCSAVMNTAANSKHSPTAATPQNAAIRLFLSVEFIAVLQSRGQAWLHVVQYKCIRSAGRRPLDWLKIHGKGEAATSVP